MFVIFVLTLIAGQCMAESHPWIAEAKDEAWLNKHEYLVNMTIKRGTVQKIVFIGDSITEMWRSSGKDVWFKYYAPRHAYNYGIGGDTVENVLYRVEHKEFDGMKPKVAVLMIGITLFLNKLIRKIE